MRRRPWGTRKREVAFGEVARIRVHHFQPPPEIDPGDREFIWLELKVNDHVRLGGAAAEKVSKLSVRLSQITELPIERTSSLE